MKSFKSLSLAAALVVAALVFSAPAHATTTNSHRGQLVGGVYAPSCVSYVHHTTLRKTCKGCNSCAPDITALLQVTDPACCDNCLTIPVCLPACCCDVPTCSSRCGVLGRRVVTYKWCCGYKVDVVFKRCGDVVVHSYGR